MVHLDNRLCCIHVSSSTYRVLPYCLDNRHMKLKKKDTNL